jgi:hypothetical protein
MSFAVRMVRRALALLAITAASSQAQSPGPPPTPRRVAPDMVDFLTGRWSCQGTFASGKAIAANMEFHEILNGAWLSASHDDVPPNAFHAMTLWGTPRGGGFVAHIADSGGGMRRLVSTEGWKDGKITIARDTTLTSPQFTGRYAEHFVYARESATTFRMTYETQIGEGTAWRLGDTLLCTKQ